MSRAYRIKVSESLHKIIKANDRVSTHLEILNVLPQEEMAELLAQELLRRGFVQEDGELVREKDGIVVSVDPQEGIVTVSVCASEEVDIEVEQTGLSTDLEGKHAAQVKETLKKNLQAKLKREADAKQADLQSQLTDLLEAQLGDLRKELNEIANRVTADALKRKASQMGQIKEVSEDPQSGSMTIVLEV